MSYPRCLITGCELVVLGEGKWVHGDLHELGNAFIFNAVMHNYEAAWQHDNSYSLRKFVLHLPEGRGYFERRGVIIIVKSDCFFGSSVQEKINASSR